LLYTTSSNGAMDVHVMQADGTGRTKVSADPVGSITGHPAWSPDGRYIVMPLGSQIVVVDIASLAPVATAKGTLPVWAPVGNRLAFVSGNHRLQVMNADGSGLVGLAAIREPDLHFQWLPNGTQLVTIAQHELVIVNADGSGQLQLTNNPDGAIHYNHPAVSPDGTRIAFSSQRDVQRDIYVVNIDGTGLTNIVADHNHDDQPVWSPDGTRLTFVRDAWSLWVMNADGSGLMQLPAPRDYSWSPDGTRIYFTRGNVTNLFAIYPDGTGEVQVTAERATGIDWKP
jgi:TolB protein